MFFPCLFQKQKTWIPKLKFKVSVHTFSPTTKKTLNFKVSKSPELLEEGRHGVSVMVDQDPAGPGAAHIIVKKPQNCHI